MKKLILDKSKWRCGGNSPETGCGLGEGSTLLKNDLGFMCCLGQFAPQLNPEIEENDLLGVSDPEGLNMEVPRLSIAVETDYNWQDTKLSNTKLSDDAMEINDDELSSVDEKIAHLKALFAKEGYEIEVIN